MDANPAYDRQVRLLTRVLPIVAAEADFALKGGTAINLFIRDLPRLSVDIDLVYLPMDDRDTALRRTAQALSRIAETVEKTLRGAEVIRSFEHQQDALRLFVGQGADRIKIELSPVLRGSVFPPEVRGVMPTVEEQYGFAEMNLLSLPDIYAGKICAALDRQHPRDLFDIKLLLENEGIDDDLLRTFLVYLISHNRTMTELLQPVRKDIRGLYDGEFLSMARVEVPLADLLDVREQLVSVIHASFTDDHKRFLISFKSGAPEWELLGLKGVDQLPAVRWKQLNLERMAPDRRANLLAQLEDTLDGNR